MDDLGFGERAMGAEYCARLARKFDVDGDGRVDYGEFMAYIGEWHDEAQDSSDALMRVRKEFKKLGRASGKGLEQVFHEMDEAEGGRGAISARGLRKACNSLGMKLTAEDADRVVGSFDLSGDGEIDYREFLGFITGEEEGREGEDDDDDEDEEDEEEDDDDDDDESDFDEDDLDDDVLALRDDLRYKVRKAERKGVNVRSAFRHFDANSSGSISQQEFTDGLDELGLSVSSRDAKKLFRGFRGGGKNEVNYRRFLKMVGATKGKKAKKGKKEKERRRRKKKKKEKENRYDSDDDSDDDSEEESDDDDDEYERKRKKRRSAKKKSRRRRDD